MSEVSTMFNLSPKTKRAKQILREHGVLWHCWRFDENLPCFDGQPGLLISPYGLPWHCNESRWIRATADGRPASEMFDVQVVS